ncbi:hypothetical protein EDD15DRAFT_2295205 [Pisolithus albus]|nr:hypothetical protein EDD15DRAFT_2295205 [Pisolithus albus]
MLLLLPYNQRGGYCSQNITRFGRSLVRLSTVHNSFTTTRYYMHDAHGSWVAGFRWPLEMCPEAFEYGIILRQIPRRRHQAQPAKVSWREESMREKPRPRDACCCRPSADRRKSKVLCRLTLMWGELGLMQMWSVRRVNRADPWCGDVKRQTSRNHQTYVFKAKYPVSVTLLQWEVQGSSDCLCTRTYAIILAV